MLLWFGVFSVLGVYAVFRDDLMDYRFVAVGSLLPDAVDAAIRRGKGPFHSLVVGVTLLFAVVLATIGRRAVRKRWLAVPVGMFAHLVLDAAWADTGGFWWPLTGWSFSGRLPVVQHGLLIGLLEEALAIAAAVWIWRAFGFADRRRRLQFVRTGQLPQQRPRPRPRAGARRVGR